MSLIAVQEVPSGGTNQDKFIPSLDLQLAGFSPIQLKDENLQTFLLADGHRLQEVYDLRLKVWEQKGSGDVVNRTLFPDGWYDELDDSGFHWITINSFHEIIAAARLNIFHSLKESPYFEATQHLRFPESEPFAFYSRLVVHPDYRSRSLSKKLYQLRAAYCDELRLSQSQLFTNNPYVISLYRDNGFKVAGKAKVSYHSSLVPHEVHVLAKGY